MKRKIFLPVFILLSTLITFAQETELKPESRPLNNIYINVLGDASLLSANYDRQFKLNKTTYLSANLGLGWGLWPGILGSEGNEYVTIPHHISFNFGKIRHFIELGIGGTLIYDDSNLKYYAYPIIGYRLMPIIKNKVNFRIYFGYPLNIPDGVFLIPIGMSLGLSF